jgi:hypothetical protein
MEDTESVSGEVWAVPYMPREKWMDHPRHVWAAVEQGLIEAGYGGKVRQAREITGAIAYDPPSQGRFLRGTAELADDLGAPVGQMFTVCALRARPS